MSKIFFNQQVSPRLFKTNNPPNSKSQSFYYENHLADSIEELTRTNLRMLAGIDTLSQMAQEAAKKSERRHVEQNQEIQNHMTNSFQRLAAELNDIMAQIEAFENTRAEQRKAEQDLLQSIKEKQLQSERRQKEENHLSQNSFQDINQKVVELAALTSEINHLGVKQNETTLKNFAAAITLLQSINERQMENERSQKEENKRNQGLFEDMDQKVDELITLSNETHNHDKEQNGTILKNYETTLSLLESIDEKQGKFTENQAEGMDLAQLLFQELNKKLGDIPTQIAGLTEENEKQTKTLLENHEMEQALLQDLHERQIKMAQRQTKGLDLTQSTLEEIKELNERVTRQNGRLVEH